MSKTRDTILPLPQTIECRWQEQPARSEVSAVSAVYQQINIQHQLLWLSCLGCSHSVMTLICLTSLSRDYPASRHNGSPPHLVMSHFSFMCKWESLSSFTTREGKPNEIIIKFLPGQFIPYSWAICLFWWLETSQTWLDLNINTTLSHVWREGMMEGGGRRRGVINKLITLLTS